MTSGKFFDDRTLLIPCPACGHSSQKSVRWVKANNSLVCTCGETITLEPEELLRALKQSEKALTDLAAGFKKLGK